MRCHLKNPMISKNTLATLTKTAIAVLMVLSGSVMLEASSAVAEQGYNFTRISGSSMLPTLKSGETAVVFENYPFNKVRVGDVVIIKSEKGFNVIHRVLRRYRGGLWVTKGDNNRFEDREVLTSKNFGGLALVGDSMNRYHEYLSNKGIEPLYGIEKDQIALANTSGTIR